MFHSANARTAKMVSLASVGTKIEGQLQKKLGSLKGHIYFHKYKQM
jgi:hypothetical protein